MSLHLKIHPITEENQFESWQGCGRLSADTVAMTSITNYYIPQRPNMLKRNTTQDIIRCCIRVKNNTDVKLVNPQTYVVEGEMPIPPKDIQPMGDGTIVAHRRISYGFIRPSSSSGVICWDISDVHGKYSEHNLVLKYKIPFNRVMESNKLSLGIVPKQFFQEQRYPLMWLFHTDTIEGFDSILHTHRSEDGSFCIINHKCIPLIKITGDIEPDAAANINIIIDKI